MKSDLLKSVLSIVLAVLLATFCFSCGSGTLIAGGGMGGSGIISKGIILAFGSIVVNGTEFDTTHALVIINGEEIGVGDEAVLDNLDIGQYVTVIGSGNEEDANATAEKIIYSRNLEGPVELISDFDETTKEMIVLGQTIVVNGLTEFKGTGFEAISINDILEISGFPDDKGIIHATFIEKTGAFVSGDSVEVTGTVNNLDSVLKTFQIKNLTIDYSMVDTENIPDGLLAEGSFVEVEGTLSSFEENLTATRIEKADELDITEADQMEVMGFVVNGLSDSEFKLGNHRVRIDETVEYVDGEPEDIIPGVKLEAEGMLVDGILHAWEIEFWGPDQIEHEGTITRMVSITEFTVDSQVVYTDEGTVFEDGIAENLSIGINVEIKGRMIDGILVADKVSFELE